MSQPTDLSQPGNTPTALLEFRGVRKTFGSGETAVHADRSPAWPSKPVSLWW